MHFLDKRQEFAVDLVHRAGQLALNMRISLGPVEAKSALDFCTQADQAVEQLIRNEIKGFFGEPIIGEEFGGTPHENVWVVDPIDGTMGYIHGNGRWCISLAFMKGGEVELGIIYSPTDNRLFVARRGGGSWLNHRRISVSHLSHGAAPVVEVGWSERRSLSGYADILHGLTRESIEFRRHGSGALGLAEVACGINDGYIELHINAWDALAGILLVREAGGWTNDFLADGGLTNGNLLVAGTPEIREPLLAVAGASTS